MTIQVFNGSHKISTSEDLFTRTSQCVAVGMVDSTQNLAGVVQIHFRSDHERMLSALIEGLMAIDGHQANYRLGVGGGVDTFVPGYGFIPGGHNADRVIEYLTKNGFENAISEGVVDIYTDYIRNLFAYTSKRELEIKRLKIK